MKLSFCGLIKTDLGSAKRLISNIEDMVDEIVIVDTGSDQKVIDFFQQKSITLIRAEWKNDFSLYRNLAIEKSSGDWILSLDSDETITDELKKKIKMLPLISATKEGYRFRRIHFYDEKNPLMDHWKPLRLYQRSARYSGVVHESICNLKNVEEINDKDCCIEHHNTREGERRKFLKYRANLRALLQEAENRRDQRMSEYFKFNLWVQEEVYFKEINSNITQDRINDLYNSYNQKKEQYLKMVSQKGWTAV